MSYNKSYPCKYNISKLKGNTFKFNTPKKFSLFLKHLRYILLRICIETLKVVSN